MRKHNFENFKKTMSGKGYYIALVLCAIAIGISGYMYYRTANQKNPASDPDVQAGITQPQDVPVIVRPTLPDQTTPGAILPDPTTPGTTKPQSSKPMKTAAPVKGQTVAAYAMDSLAYNPTTRDWRVHNGMDISAEAGTQVCAAAAGTVKKVYEDDRLGMTVVISHQDGYETTYASLGEKVLVKAGETVKLGQAIGTVGNTALLESAVGDHVHFAVTCDGEPVDPVEFLNQD